MVSAVVSVKPIPEVGVTKKMKILPEPSLVPTLQTKNSLSMLEDPKENPKLIAPKNLAPLASKSKAVLPTLPILQSSSISKAAQGYSGNPFDGKHGNHLKISDLEKDLELDSMMTVMPGTDPHFDEITAIMGRNGSMAELTSPKRSPVPKLDKFQSTVDE